MPQNSEFQAQFDAAVGLLSRRDFKGGVEALQAIRGKGWVSADLEANLGHALVEVGQIGPGIQHLMNAVSLDRFDEVHRRDLALAQSKVEGGLGLPSSHPAEFGNHIASYVRPREAFSMASLLLLILLGAALLGKLRKATGWTLGGGLAVLLGIGIFASFSSSVYVLSHDSELRMSPLDSAEVAQTLKSGTRLRLLRSSGAFAEVERTNSFRGWIKEDSLVKSPY